MAEFGMLMAIIGTLIPPRSSATPGSSSDCCWVQRWAAMGVWVPMTAMPQQTRSHTRSAPLRGAGRDRQYYSYTHG
jgi:hypothetical protein